MARTKNLAVTAITLIAALVAVNTTNAQEKGEKAHAPQWETMCQDNTEGDEARALSRVTGPGTLTVHPGFECRIHVRHRSIKCPDTSKMGVPEDIGATKSCRKMPSDIEPHQKGFGDNVRAQFSAPADLGTHNVTFTAGGESHTVTLNVVARPLTPATGWTRDEGEELTERVDALPGAQRRHNLELGGSIYTLRSDSYRGTTRYWHGFGHYSKTRFMLGVSTGFASTHLKKSPVVIDVGEDSRMYTLDFGLEPGIAVPLGEGEVATFLASGILGIGIHLISDSPISQYRDGTIVMGDTGSLLSPMLGLEVGFQLCYEGFCALPNARLDVTWEPDEHGAGSEWKDDMTAQGRLMPGLKFGGRW